MAVALRDVSSRKEYAPYTNPKPCKTAEEVNSFRAANAFSITCSYRGPRLVTLNGSKLAIAAYDSTGVLQLHDLASTSLLSHEVLMSTFGPADVWSKPCAHGFLHLKVEKNSENELQACALFDGSISEGFVQFTKWNKDKFLFNAVQFDGNIPDETAVPISVHVMRSGSDSNNGNFVLFVLAVWKEGPKQFSGALDLKYAISLPAFNAKLLERLNSFKPTAILPNLLASVHYKTSLDDFGLSTSTVATADLKKHAWASSTKIGTSEFWLQTRYRTVGVADKMIYGGQDPTDIITTMHLVGSKHITSDLPEARILDMLWLADNRALYLETQPIKISGVKRSVPVSYAMSSDDVRAYISKSMPNIDEDFADVDV